MATPTISFDVTFRSQRFDDAAAGVESLAKAIGQDFDGRVGPVVSSELKRFLVNVAEALAQRHGSLYPSGTTNNSLSRRSGELINSIKESINVRGTKLADIIGEIGGSFYAKTHEYGATIRPTRSKYLTVPLPAALNSNGTPKKQSAREWSNTFVLRSKKGNLLIVQRQGKQLIPLYVLKTEVKIPPRLNLENTVNAGLQKFTDDLGDRLVKELFG